MAAFEKPTKKTAGGRFINVKVENTKVLKYMENDLTIVYKGCV